MRRLDDKCVKSSISHEIEVNVFAINKYFPWGIISFILVGRRFHSQFCNQKHFVIPLTVEVEIGMRFVL